MKMAAALDRLPTEILPGILKFLGCHCSGKHLPEPPDAYIRGDRQEQAAICPQLRKLISKDEADALRVVAHASGIEELQLLSAADLLTSLRLQRSLSAVNAVRYLSRHRATLESLHLDLRKRGHTQDGPEPRAIFSLREFTALKHLFLNLDEFYTRFWAGSHGGDPELLVQLLPPGITSIHLTRHITGGASSPGGKPAGPCSRCFERPIPEAGAG
ncbi:hypothetical protein ALT_0330 [Aspergillus lentulus]|uniref:Uncharacterized protein n=1 Tax=Aspergillus lentulus TaxID=293939 RepID=A0AAN5YEJ8_ASPLE|nr:uncharacterized protein IFM58399_00695 [Aspergillus lentulus]KAF4160796.1 hypothetical protein CNMCM6936_003795 [Aspergillus lentulus]KAF4171292.1 hypothetical protein CNMCM8060_003157 [Aspergillus lentulus]KAF4177393.1 hypothetical protein CNMCM7927_003207 [Aspergillus lentulus]KAF4190568.1 hypothetical protein CNMCM8694_003563 [Aspergillus lentulus]KAF4200221.1 hypothetical protein CNMCM8927_003687 [Aspergillus lentulus]